MKNNSNEQEKISLKEWFHFWLFILICCIALAFIVLVAIGLWFGALYLPDYLLA